MSSYSIGYLTFKNKREATSICHALLKEKLIACANILPAHTTLYKWKGKNVLGKETAVLIKTSARLQKQVAQRVKELHSYEVPCVVFWRFTTPLSPFTDWIEDQTR